MSPLRATTSGATAAWGLFSSPIGTPRLTIRGGAAASTIIRRNGAGGKMRHVAHRPHALMKIPRARKNPHIARMADFLGRMVRVLAAVVMQRFDQRGTCRHGMFSAERVVGEIHQVM